MKKYGLSFISDEDLFSQVKETAEKYRFKIDLKKFNKNLIDPIKLTFDSKVYQRTIEEVIESESLRQIDKSNTNHIGYFNQNIFRYLGGKKWTVPESGFDIVNEEKKVFVEMKNKHNTMNSSSSQKTYMRMMHQIRKEKDSTCILVEIIARNSQDIPWKCSLDGSSISDENIRRMSIDKFYEFVTGEKEAFKQLCEVLPRVIDDVILEIGNGFENNTVLQELRKIDPNILKSIYLLSFDKYEGFNNFNV